MPVSLHKCVGQLCTHQDTPGFALYGGNFNQNAQQDFASLPVRRPVRHILVSKMQMVASQIPTVQ